MLRLLSSVTGCDIVQLVSERLSLQISHACAAVGSHILHLVASSAAGELAVADVDILYEFGISIVLKLESGLKVTSQRHSTPGIMLPLSVLR